MAAEGNIVGEVGLLVKPIDPNAQFNKGVDEIIRRLEKQAQFQVKASGLDDVQKQANSAGQAFQNAAIQAAGLTAAIYGIKAGIEGAIGRFSKLFDQLAQARAGFTSILHSEAAGGALLDDIREFARVSPFVTQELVNYSQQLLGVGLAAEKIIPLLKSTGDIISSVGGDTTNLGRVLFTLTQIKSIGVLKGQDTMQLQNSLIPITKYLSDYLHKTSQEIIKMREAGLLTADIVFAALNEQGEKVKGAMDRATRNIAGARAILNDTITQLFQDQPVLNAIFTDIFEGIKKLADKMGEADFQQAFAQFFDGVNTVYEGIKPLFTALAEVSGSGAITGLQLIGTTLGTVGDALSSIPKPAMEAFARLLIALGTIKAPLLLIKYITSIKTLAAAIIPTVPLITRMGVANNQMAASAGVAAVAIKAESVAINQQTGFWKLNTLEATKASIASRAAASVRKHSSGVGTTLAIGATLAGGYLQSKEGSAAQTAGGALSGAGIGATVGMAAGPGGAAVGAVVGLALGAVTGFMNEAKSKARKHIEDLKKLGSEAAQAFIEEEGKKFSKGVTGAEFTDFKAEIAKVDDQIREIINGPGMQEARAFADRFGIDFVIPEIEGLNTQIEELKSAEAAIFDPIIFGLEELVPLLAEGSAGWLALTKATKGGRIPTDNIVLADEALKKYGYTIDDMKDPERRAAVAAFIPVFDSLTTAEQNATREANELIAALDKTKAITQERFGSQQKVMENEMSVTAAHEAAVKAAYGITTEEQKAQFDLANFKSASVVYETTLAKLKKEGVSDAWALVGAEAARGIELEKNLRLSQSGTTIRDRDGVRHDAAPGDSVNPSFDFNLGQMAREREEKERLAKEAEEAAEKAAKEAEAAAKKAAEEAIRAAEEWAATMKSAGDSLASDLESAAKEIAAAADRWVGSIKERTQYEQAVSTTRLIKNTKRQTDDLAEMTVGLAALKGRGLSAEVLEALGIDNVADLKQVRKLLKSSDTDLATLSSSVAERGEKAIDIATQEEDKRTQKNIEEGIVAAAMTLGMNKTDAKAAGAGIATQFTFNTTSNADEIAAQILAILTGGAISQ